MAEQKFDVEVVIPDGHNPQAKIWGVVLTVDQTFDLIQELLGYDPRTGYDDRWTWDDYEP